MIPIHKHQCAANFGGVRFRDIEFVASHALWAGAFRAKEASKSAEMQGIVAFPVTLSEILTSSG